MNYFAPEVLALRVIVPAWARMVLMRVPMTSRTPGNVQHTLSLWPYSSSLEFTTTEARAEHRRGAVYVLVVTEDETRAVALNRDYGLVSELDPQLAYAYGTTLGYHVREVFVDGERPESWPKSAASTAFFVDLAMKPVATAVA